MSQRGTQAMAEKMKNTSRPKILVTGATGYIASHVIQYLLEHDYLVRGTVRSLSNRSRVQPLKDLFPSLELVEADLMSDKGWKEAVTGCRDVIHVASPVPERMPPNPDDVIRPAVDGTLRVLEACLGVVRRVVITSSIMAIRGESKETSSFILTEDDWPDLASSQLDAYSRSKVLAERAAMDFVAKHPDCFELVTLHPTIIIGPVLLPSTCTSVHLIKNAMDGRVPMCPEVNFPIGDVRDTAIAHVKALEAKEAVGQRHIIGTKDMWMKEIMDILKEEFGPLGYSLPSQRAPNFLIWMFSFWDEGAGNLYRWMGKAWHFKNDRMRKVLGVEPRDIKVTILDTAHSLIKLGLVKKTQQYQEKFEASTNL